jgi:acyl carrier protein
MIYEKLLEIIHKIMPDLDTTKITLDSVLTRDLGFDSLNTILVALTIEEEFNFRFESTSDLITVKDICDYVEAHAKVSQ